MSSWPTCLGPIPVAPLVISTGVHPNLDYFLPVYFGLLPASVTSCQCYFLLVYFLILHVLLYLRPQLVSRHGDSPPPVPPSSLCQEPLAWAYIQSYSTVGVLHTIPVELKKSLLQQPFCNLHSSSIYYRVMTLCVGIPSFLPSPCELPAYEVSP